MQSTVRASAPARHHLHTGVRNDRPRFAPAYQRRSGKGGGMNDELPIDEVVPGAATPAARHEPWLRRRTLEQIFPWIVIVLFFLLWEIAVRLFSIPRFLLPAPSIIFATLWEYRWPILDNAWQTLMTTSVGFAFAIVFGLVGGVL